MASAENRIAGQAASGGDPVLAEMITEGLHLIHVLQVYTCAMMAVAVWDWLVCLKAEWQRIWLREWSLVKVLYLWTRYYSLLCFALNLWLFNAEFTAERCKTLHYLIAATCMWASLGSETILAIRTYAFLGKKAWMGYAFIVALLGETAFLLYVSIAGVNQTPPIFEVGPCTATDKPGQHIVSGFWLAPVAFDLICTSLTVYKAFTLRGMGVRSGIVAIFVREGLFYFLAVAGVNIINAAFMFQPNVRIQNINAYLALVLTQVLCCRLVLNLRRADSSAANFSSTPGHSNISGNSTIQFSTGNGARGTRSQRQVIPLSDFGRPYAKDEDYPDSGVKIQVDVERDADSIGRNGDNNKMVAA